MSFPGRATLPASVSTTDTARPGKGPLGALPVLSGTARRALALTGVLALVNAGALVAQAFLLASACAVIVAGQGVPLGQLAALTGVVAARAGIAWAMRLVAARAAAGAKEELRAKAVDHALRLGPEWIAARGPGALTALATSGLDALDAYFTQYLPALVTAAVVPLGAGAAVVVADWPSAMIIALTVPLLPVFAILVGRYTAERSAAAVEAVHRLSGQLLELVRALPVLAAFQRAEAQAETVRAVSDRHRRATMRTLRIAFSSAFVLELVAMLSVALVAVAIGVRLVSGELPLVIGLGVLILAPECYQPLRAVGAAFHASEDGVEAVRRVAGILAEPLPPHGTESASPGEVRVEGLRVARRDGFAPDGATFAVRPGETVWLRSPSGSGKTTTIAVLLGFVRPTGGTVTVAGIPLSDLDPVSWRRDLAWVPQSPAFAGGTVRAELELSLADREDPSPGEIEDVLASVDLADFASARVDQLSVGQRQRVAVARALLRVRHGAWLLLLDEPTAHLDAPNAVRVMAAVETARRSGAAVIIAAHRRPEGEVTRTPVSLTARPGEETTETGRGPWSFLSPWARTRNSVHGLDSRLLAGSALGALALLAGLALTATSGWLIAEASRQPPILTLTVAVVGVRAFGLLRAGLRYAERLTTHDASFRIAGRLRVQLWRALVRIGPARASALRHGEGQRRLVADVDTVRDLLPRVLTPPVVAGAALLGAVVVDTLLLPWAGLVLAVAVLTAALGGPLFAVRMERRATATLAAGRRDVSAKVLELFSSAGELLAFGAHRTHRDELARTDSWLAARSRRQALGSGAADALITLCTGLAAVAGTWLAATSDGLNPVLAPVIALIPLAAAEVLALLPAVAQHADTLRNARSRLAGLAEVPSAPSPEPHRGSPEAVELRGDIGWPDGEIVLHDVDVRIPAGRWAALVGPSGAGKSTLVAALLGFLGARGSLPAKAAWAPQDPGLVSTTVAENLRLADPHASDDRLAEALRLACLPGLRLDTVLDSAGSGLSGGQAQRLALARALVAAPAAELVLLDEPTAHLDEPTAREIRENLRTALAGKTVVHVTHHPGEAEDADMVLEVRDGRVRVLEGVYA
ncbi:thiol reductant ABC exporter subunit CydD [Amycolatopsis pigmentata]|uniref:Thiol reductant ABC exporter subunit CydD n=1 Tax=Amycolatopsis pigmentata TaxID=450801 RepID=A0ABW5FTM2_9PSEU